jgi:poly(beta-D-mannuronate) lyase
MIADSIVMSNNVFMNSDCNKIMMESEKEDKGYYSAERITLTNNVFLHQEGVILNVYRGGNDESTMGPILVLRNNSFEVCTTANPETPLISLYGVQHSLIEKNNFQHCNGGSVLIKFGDAVRANHLFKNNTLQKSGSMITDKFVQSEGNIVQ